MANTNQAGRAAATFVLAGLALAGCAAIGTSVNSFLLDDSVCDAVEIFDKAAKSIVLDQTLSFPAPNRASEIAPVRQYMRDVGAIYNVKYGQVRMQALLTMEFGAPHMAPQVVDAAIEYSCPRKPGGPGANL